MALLLLCVLFLSVAVLTGISPKNTMTQEEPTPQLEATDGKEEVLCTVVQEKPEEVSTETSQNQKDSENIFFGYFTITHYSIDSCGKMPDHPAYGITSTGTCAIPGRTIAVDPRVIPYGTTVVIDGHEYLAEDCGGSIKGNKIDICVSSNEEAFQKGVLYNVPVYIKKA